MAQPGRPLTARPRFEPGSTGSPRTSVSTRSAATTGAARSSSLESLGEVPWLQPYPDRLLDEMAPREAEPDAVAVARETIELAFLAAVQLLPPRQRAVLILRDVVEWSAKETATLLDMSVVAVNSALQRARATMAANRPHGRVGKPPPAPTPEELASSSARSTHIERADVAAMAEMLREDVRIAMPPLPFWFNGKETFVPGLKAGLMDPGEWRLVAIGANRSPAMATYLRAWDETEFRAFKIDVLRIEDGGRRRDHDLRRVALPGLRAATDAVGPVDYAVSPGDSQRYPLSVTRSNHALALSRPRSLRPASWIGWVLRWIDRPDEVDRLHELHPRRPAPERRASRSAGSGRTARRLGDRADRRRRSRGSGSPGLPS